MQQYALSKEQKPWVWAAVGLTALLTLLSSIYFASGNFTQFSFKVIITAFMLFWCGIAAYSGAKWLKKNNPLYGLGIITLIISIKAFFIFALLVFGEISSIGFLKYSLVLLIASLTLGYICGIATIRTNHGSVYYLKLFAFCCVAVIGLYYMIIILKIPPYRRFSPYRMEEFLFNNEQSSRLLATLLLLALSLTCMAKSISRLHEEETPYQHI